MVTILVSQGESPWSLTREREREREHECVCVNVGWGVNRRWCEPELSCEWRWCEPLWVIDVCLSSPPEIKEILHLAALNELEVIPLVQTFGHMEVSGRNKGS